MNAKAGSWSGAFYIHDISSKTMVIPVDAYFPLIDSFDLVGEAKELERPS